MKLIEVIVQSCITTDDATMTIVNIHYITKGQYVAIIYMYKVTKPAILVVTKLIVVLQWGNKGGEGKVG